MFKKVTKKLVLGLLMFAMLITTVVFMPADAQAATKKAKKATVYEYYTVRRHIAGGANRTLISVITPFRLCRIGTCRRLSSG